LIEYLFCGTINKNRKATRKLDGDDSMGKNESIALQDALASSSMEGFKITVQTERDCQRLMSGKITVKKLVREILSRPAAKTV